MYSIFKVRRTESQWQQETGLVLFTWSIINPNGPTLSCVGIRNCGCPGQVEVFYRWLHFHGGESFVLGYVSEDSNDFAAEILEVLDYAFRQDPGRAMQRFPLVSCVPSFVTLPASDVAQKLTNATDIEGLISGSRGFREADWGREMYYLKKYGSRFFDRAAEETRAALESAAQDPDLTADGRQYLEMTRIARGHLPGFNDWRPNQYKPRALADGDVRWWWSVVTSEDFTTSCLTQLAKAWVGATYQVRQAAVDPAEPFELVKDFLEVHHCYLWPEEWDSAYLREKMGLIE
jgi:hypothetical protein